jgi:hypothetical protein
MDQPPSKKRHCHYNSRKSSAISKNPALFLFAQSSMISSLEKRVPMSLLWGSVKIWNIDLQEHLIRLVYCEIKNKQPKILLSESLTIESIDREACSAFFERLRSVDQKNANDLAICLPEKNLLIKPLPTYPYLKKKELSQALSVYQEQILPGPTRNQTCAYCILLKMRFKKKRKSLFRVSLCFRS